MKGDADAFMELIEENMQGLYKIGWAYLKQEEDIADAIQDTILNCYEKLHTLRQPKYFKTWMFRIMINSCKDILKKRNTYLSSDYELTEEGTHDFEESEWKMLLNNLDENYRVVLLLYFYKQMTLKEIGKVLDVSKNTAATWLRRGKEQLRKEWEK